MAYADLLGTMQNVASNLVQQLAGQLQQLNPQLTLPDFAGEPGGPFTAADLFRIWGFHMPRREQAATVTLFVLGSTQLLADAVGPVSDNELFDAWMARLTTFLEPRYEADTAATLAFVLTAMLRGFLPLLPLEE